MNGLASELMRFFAADNSIADGQMKAKSVDDFLKFVKSKVPQRAIATACSKLEEAEVLYAAHTDHQWPPPFGRHYVHFSPLDMVERQASYGTYDFVVHGFPLIRRHFLPAIRPLFLETADGTKDVGTGFVLRDGRFVTAAHCVQHMRSIRIGGCETSQVNVSHLSIPSDERVDLAVFNFVDPGPFSEVHGLEVSYAEPLDAVLTMGYPPIPGLDPCPVAETATVGAEIELRSSVGEVVSEPNSYLSRQTYYLISARVKGGNSGGPAINKVGKVVGVVTDMPAESEGRVDVLGYGLVTRGLDLQHFLDSASGHGEGVQDVPFRLVDGVISTQRSV